MGRGQKPEKPSGRNLMMLNWLWGGQGGSSGPVRGVAASATAARSPGDIACRMHGTAV